MNLCQECLDVIEIAVRVLTSGSPADAARMFSKVIEAIVGEKGIEYQELHALALYNLSQVHDRLKQPEEASNLREEAAAQLQEIETSGTMLALENRLADTLIELGEFRRAIPFCEHAIKLSGKSALKVANCLWRAGRCYLRAASRSGRKNRCAKRSKSSAMRKRIRERP
jgi:tetratricopeptide (TPR) repeat protein